MKAVWEAFSLAVRSVVRSGLRSFLTILGVLIGIAAVVLVVALAESARSRVSEQIQGLGSNLIYVFNMPGGGQSRGRSGARLSLADAEAIRREAGNLEAVTVYAATKLDVQGSFDTARIDVAGADEHYVSVRGQSVTSGRDLNAADTRAKSRVALIGVTAARRLFGADDPVGSWVRVGRHRFEVVGLLSEKGQAAFGSDPDDSIIVPIRTWQTRVAPERGTRVDTIIASAPTSESVDDYRERIDQVMVERRRLPQDGRRDFRLLTPDGFREAQEAIFGVLTLVLVSVAGISLFVGGLGVMNILFVSVNERQREIGTRLSIGARPRDIRLQFLAEAVTLTLLGGVLGVVVATLGVFTLEQQLGWAMRISPGAVTLALLVSSLTGLVFGTLPAQRAARLDPIEALRHD